MSSVSCTI